MGYRQSRIMFLFVMNIMMLGGCADMNSKFDCPMKPGVRCESLDQINARVDRGELGSMTTPSYSPVASDDGYASADTKSANPPFRHKEKVMHIWVAPYEDKDGNYHDGNNIYAVSKASQWDRG